MMDDLKLKIREHERSDGTTYYKGSFSPIRIDNEKTGILVVEVNDLISAEEPDDLDEQYAKRIVACVNALSGIPLEDIQKFVETLK